MSRWTLAGAARRYRGSALEEFVRRIRELVTSLFFWWSMHFLLAGRVRWRELAVPALLTATFWIGLEAFSAAYFSSTINSDSAVYGSIGVVFSLLTWFTAIAAVVILGAVAGDILQSRACAWRARRRHGISNAGEASHDAEPVG